MQHKENIFSTSMTGNVHFFVHFRLAVIMKHFWQRNMIYLEEEFSLGCPLFMYEDTTPTCMSYVYIEDAAQ